MADLRPDTSGRPADDGRRLPGTQTATIFPTIVGHSSACAVLSRAIGAGRIGQAYLFSGPEGVGKRTTAHTLAATLHCEQPCSPHQHACATCSACRRSATHQHPDTITISADERHIRIATIRTLHEQLAFAPFESTRRVVIIDGAEDLNPAAANAMLKLLEEPPPMTSFILIAASPQVLMPTLRSRCQRIHFGPLSREETAQVVATHSENMGNESAQNPGALLDIAEGSPGRALSLANDPLFAKASACVDEISSAIDPNERRRAPDIFRLSADFGRERAVVQQAIQILKARLHGSLRRLPESLSAQRHRTRKICRRIRTLDEIHTALEQNANVALALETLIFGLREESP